MTQIDLATASILLAAAAGLANILGGFVIVVRRHWPEKALARTLATSAGFLLAIAFLELIPESVEADPANALFVLAGFVAIHLLHGVFLDGHVHHPPAFKPSDHHHHHHHGGRNHALTGGALTGMLVHTFFDGVSIAAGFAASVKAGLLVFLAVLLHKIPDGLVVASIMLATSQGRRRAFLASLALGGSTLLGAVLMNLLFAPGTVGDPPAIAGAALALSAGIFIYVAASDLIPEVAEARNRDLSLLVVAGMAVFYFTDLLLARVGLM